MKDSILHAQQRRGPWLMALCLVLIGSASASAQPPVDVTRRPAPPAPAASVPGQDYRIGADDVLDVAYWGDKDMSAEVVVRPDGRIALPLVGEIDAAGLTPAQLTDRIKEMASVVLETPMPIVAVKEINSRQVFITGEVARPGSYPLSGPTTVLQLIARAGGLGEFADDKHIVIMRMDQGVQTLFTFNYRMLSKLGETGGASPRDRRARKQSADATAGLEQNILLMPGDTVLVP